ncbi:MAG: glycosyltransferase family 4 protein [Candidatus Omnitrophota bacterium]
MRIALFAWESMHSISVGGVAFHVTELACALERKGHEVHVFTRMGAAGQPWYDRIHGVHYHRCPFDSNRDFTEEIGEMCRSFVHSFFQTEDHIGPFDVIHAHDWLTVDALSWIKESRNRKSILTIHSTEYGRCGNIFFGGSSEKIRDCERHGTHRADRVIAVSTALKNEIMWMYNLSDRKVSVVYNGVNYRNYDGWIDAGAVRGMYGIGPTDPMVLFVGRMVYQKGPELLIEAMPHVLKYHDNAKAVFVGDGEMRRGMEDKARHMGLSYAVKCLGYVKGWRLVDLYKASDVVCIPSRNEPFGITMLEAWSAGKPVVASQNGGPGEILWHEINGLKIYPNPDSIAWGIGTIFEDFEHARWMGRNGRVAVESCFSWDTIANQTLDAYCS